MNLWKSFFKSEIRSSGEAFVNKRKVSFFQPSDTEILAYIKSSSSIKVNIKSTSITSNVLVVNCNCSNFKKGQFCKHIWATLLIINEKKPDFFDSKNELQKNSILISSKFTKSQENLNYEASYKLRQTAFRKEQYNKQKQFIKDNKLKKIISKKLKYPLEIENALNYFLANGFNLFDSITTKSVGIASKKLARIFHPDFGGSHEEILELNKHTEVLTKFSKY